MAVIYVAFWRTFTDRQDVVSCDRYFRDREVSLDQYLSPIKRDLDSCLFSPWCILHCALTSFTFSIFRLLQWRCSSITSAWDIENVKPDVTVLFHVLLKACLLENWFLWGLSAAMKWIQSWAWSSFQHENERQKPEALWTDFPARGGTAARHMMPWSEKRLSKYSGDAINYHFNADLYVTEIFSLILTILLKKECHWSVTV